MAKVRDCDGCTVCCHVLPHHDFGKPAHTDCEHADAGGVGCKIYDRRPVECNDPGGGAGFLCAWARGEIDESLKPSDVGGYIGAYTGDRIGVYGVRGKVPQALIDVALKVRRARCEVHVHHADGVKAYRDGEEVAPRIRVINLEVK